MRADRLISMMLMLHSKGRMTAQDLASQLEVSERTIYRDIEALSISGVPIYAQSGTNGGVFVDENYRISLTGLYASEVKSLFLSTASQPLADLGLGLEDTLLKIFAALPSRQQAEAQMNSVDNTYMRENDPRMPMFKERKSTVTFGKGL